VLSVAYPGRAGAHSGEAADALFGGDARVFAVPSFAAVVAAVAAGDCDAGVLPMESSLAGPVNETHDLLADAPLTIVAETILPIRHCLVALENVALDRVRAVHSHPMALDQCRRLLGELHEAMVVAAPTTADAARTVAAGGDPHQVAIASERAAREHGLVVLDHDVGDREAFTRFVALAAYARIDRGERWRTALLFATDHRPGALHRALEPFARHGIDLVQLVSRPLGGNEWRYRFDAVLAGHPLDEDVRAALAEARERTRELRVVGSYPAA
jgi:prephenate dehydratase